MLYCTKIQTVTTSKITEMKTPPNIRRACLVLKEAMISFRVALEATKTKKVIANMANITISKTITLQFIPTMSCSHCFRTITS